MKVLVIPDVHLKPFMFQQAAALMKQGIAERAVCLMDIPDDWNKEYDCQLYEETYDEAIRFAEQFPETLWCYGTMIYLISGIRWRVGIVPRQLILFRKSCWISGRRFQRIIQSSIYKR